MDDDEEKCKETVKDPYSPPDELTKNIMLLHYIFLGCSAYFIIYKIITTIYPVLSFAGFENNPKIPLLQTVITGFFYVLHILAGLTAAVLLVILFWIFIHWLIIITFVPFIIIFPIPMFPFIFILPLQPLMLELIPPIKVLTTTGTLPTMLKISKRLINNEIITNTLKFFLYPTIEDLNRYFYSNVSQMISDYLHYDIESIYEIPPEKCKTSKKEIIDSIRPDDNIEDEKKYNEYKENSSVQKSMDKIGEDTEICNSMNHKFKEYNSSYLNDVSVDIQNSLSPYNTCYTGAIKSYLKTSITQ